MYLKKKIQNNFVQSNKENKHDNLIDKNTL